MADEEHLRILRQGVDTWNKWREEHPDIRPDLSEPGPRVADLIKAELSGANLSGAFIIQANLIEADLSVSNRGRRGPAVRAP
jgi:hypothetical protein